MQASTIYEEWLLASIANTYNLLTLYTAIAIMSQRKQEKDYTAEVTALVPEVEGLAKVGYSARL
jgi:hypothetical protein